MCFNKELADQWPGKHRMSGNFKVVWEKSWKYGQLLMFRTAVHLNLFGLLAAQTHWGVIAFHQML